MSKLLLRSTLAIALVAAIAGLTTRLLPARPARPLPARMALPKPIETGRDALARTISTMTARLAAKPDDAEAAVSLADALLRQTRVTGNAGLAMRAELTLQQSLARDPENYYTRRMLASVLLSEHRFRDAIRAAERCQQTRPDDAWSYGVIGDAHLELGEYPEAFAAFDKMMNRRPDAASYARASYARELQGDVDGAVALMQMALDATSPRDPESLAWHLAQIGHLYLVKRDIVLARRSFEHADYVFPGHPFAADGLAQVLQAEGHYQQALDIVSQRLASAPTPAALALSGDLLTSLGRAAEADRQYRLAESAWRTDVPEPARLAVFLADRGWKPEDAVTLAAGAARDRDDIFTDDALAWASFKAGRIAEARAASARALRTGSRDPMIREHARVIAIGVSSR